MLVRATYESGPRLIWKKKKRKKIDKGHIWAEKQQQLRLGPLLLAKWMQPLCYLEWRVHKSTQRGQRKSLNVRAGLKKKLWRKFKKKKPTHILAEMRKIIWNSDKLKSVEVDNATINNRLKKTRDEKQHIKSVNVKSGKQNRLADQRKRRNQKEERRCVSRRFKGPSEEDGEKPRQRTDWKTPSHIRSLIHASVFQLQSHVIFRAFREGVSFKWF